MNIAALIAIIATFGFDAYTVETESHVYAFSYASAPGVFGHPAAEAIYSVESGYLTVRGPGGAYERKILCDTHGDNECPSCTGAGFVNSWPDTSHMPDQCRVLGY